MFCSVLFNDVFKFLNEESELFCNSSFSDDSSRADYYLNRPITVQEITEACRLLKRGKACGFDQILNEYLIESCDILSSHLCDMFNHILDSGIFPEKWTEGIIVPLYKKGNVQDVNNYRGITLLSCLAKLFTSILNKRISSFCKENHTISDAQFGFRKGQSTVDALFVLTNVVQKVLNENKRLYCAFIDLKKCFDTIYRNGLWFKLHKYNIRGKVLQIFRSMYDKVKSCVRSGSKYSDFFEYAVGLSQGEITSPILVSLFLEDIELSLQSSTDTGINIEDLSLVILLFADDMVIFGKTPQELQNKLDCLYDYCSHRGLQVNASKTKIVVFRKRGTLKPCESWTYNKEKIEVVNDFNYLGVVLNFTGKFSLHFKYVNGKAKKAINFLLYKCKKFNFKPSCLMQLFDAFVGSVLSYANEILGFTKNKELEGIHLNFCKRLLNVRNSTSSLAVYGELGRYPLYVLRYISIVKYWFKVINSENNIAQYVYRSSWIDAEKGLINWVSNIKTLLCDHGFNYVWNDPNSIDPKLFLKQFAQTVKDNFIQNWFNGMESSTQLKLYSHVKTSFCCEDYLNCIPKSLRYHLSRLRMSAHDLRIQSGRFARNRIRREERYCLCCNSSDIEDEYHFIIICPCFNEIRKKYVNDFYTKRPSVFKFMNLLSETDKGTVYKLAQYIKEASAQRTLLLRRRQGFFYMHFS